MRGLDAKCVHVSWLAADICVRAAITLVLIGLPSVTSFAVTRSWDTGGGADYAWTTDVNWSSNTEPGLKRRLPSKSRIDWAQAIEKTRNGQRPRNLQEVYAEQTIWIRDNPTAELVLQGLRIGELGVAAIPNEVFAITGLKLKAQPPIQPLMNFELANGAEGYIPPPEQHFLGGYTTWPARTAGLETDAEPKISNTLLELLEKISEPGLGLSESATPFIRRAAKMLVTGPGAL
jgi:hypothetical protein